MTLSAIQKAEIDRSAQTLNISMIERKVRDHPTKPLCVTAAETQIENANKVKGFLLEIQTRIAHQQPDAAILTTHEEEYIKLVERCDDAITDLKTIIKNQTPTASVPTPRSPGRPHHSIKLPEIQLPSFEGNFEDWPSFEDLFKATVDKNPHLSSAQKLQYLKSCVKGEASTLIKSFTITDANYHEAWTLLSTRFNNKREIIYSLVKKLLQQPAVKPDSVLSLQGLLNSTLECVRSLKVLGRPVDQWDDLIVVAVIEKLDSDSKAEWAKSLTGTSPVTFKELITFMESHIRSLLARGGTNKVTPGTTKVQQPQQYFRSQHQTRSYHSSSPTCSLCKESHLLFQCKKLQEMPASSRFNAVRKTAACVNCLRDGHTSKDCSSRSSCRLCNRRHHSLLHYENEATGGGQTATDSTNSNRTVSTHSSTASTASTLTILKTAVVQLSDIFGGKQVCRAFLDDGSEASYMTQRFCSSLGLKKTRVNVLIEGVGNCEAGRAKWKVTARVFSRVNNAYVDTEFLVLPQVSGKMPRTKLDATPWTHLRGIQLADPNFHVPADVDILLGGDALAEVIKTGIRHGRKDAPIAQNTIFGWAVLGKVNSISSTVSTFHTKCDLTEIVQRFWEIEQLPPRKPFTPEEAACEEFYKATTTRNEEGRYILELPFKDQYKDSILENIGNTRNFALRRLFQLEKRFEKYPQHHASYIEFMDEYLRLGHMEPANPSSPAIYIPHHFVLKEDSTTTKLRVVFDASMKGSKNISLNDMLMVGPTIQDDCFIHLVKFRLGLVALKGDIEKMYRQYLLHPKHRNYHRILWRKSRNGPILEYNLKTATYGTGPASFLATRSLHQLAEDEGFRFPKAAAVLLSNLFVDDLLKAVNTREEAIALVMELIALLKAGGMTIRKWSSSDQTVMAAIPMELREVNTEHTFDHDPSVKALGITWNPQADTFRFKVNSSSTATTKRELLSEISKTFDPLGFLTPFTINAKILFQKVWQTSLGWDDQLHKNMQEEWSKHQQQLQLITQFAIPRCVVTQQVKKYELIGFSDSSERAMACAVYLRCTATDGSIVVNLLTSGTRVAPVKQQSIPRLELCAAVLLAERIQQLAKAIHFDYSVTCYTDSMIVLQWLSSQSRRWKTFVGTRISLIQDIVPSTQWHHVSSGENPADLPSRGISSEELLNSQLWWHGPQWLSTPSNHAISNPVIPTDMSSVLDEEKREAVSCHHSVTTTTFIVTWLANFSALRKAISTTAVFLLFIKYLQLKKKCQTLPFPIPPLERKLATEVLVKLVQSHEFCDDIRQLKKGKNVLSSSSIKSLAPFIDKEGILRVGGRLGNAPVSKDVRHPILLPKRNQLTTLIIEDCHLRHYHGGNTLVLSSIRYQYWILSGKDAVRHIIRRCIRCRRAKATTMKQLMGQLPSPRVTPHHRPFLHAGVDYAGAFNVYMKRGRGVRPEKCYFAIFVCFATKAIHLEAVTDLTTAAFIAAYKRFTARRGVCSHLYSDCGTNFVGADNELKRYIIQAEKQFQQPLAHFGTTWVFNPPAAPHQGGLWESGVKSVKMHFHRVVGARILTFEEFQTVLCSIEGCLNSRPLCPLSSDPTDLAALTPGHFLIGAPLTAVPEPDVSAIAENRLDNWQRVQQLSQHFWKRWSAEYLTSLQQRYKWTKKQDNLSTGDLVVIQDDNQPPIKWKLGRVTQVHPGKDGLVRTVTLRTVLDTSSVPVRYNEIVRPVQKLSPLLLSNDSNN